MSLGTTLIRLDECGTPPRLLVPGAMPAPVASFSHRCLDEVRAAKDTAGGFDVMLSEAQEKDLKDTLSKRISMVIDVIAAIDARKAKATLGVPIGIRTITKKREVVPISYPK